MPPTFGKTELTMEQLHARSKNGARIAKYALKLRDEEEAILSKICKDLSFDRYHMPDATFFLYLLERMHYVQDLECEIDVREVAFRVGKIFIDKFIGKKERGGGSVATAKEVEVLAREVGQLWAEKNVKMAGREDSEEEEEEEGGEEDKEEEEEEEEEDVEGEEALIKEAAVKETAIKEAAIKEAAIKEAATKETAIKKAAIKEAAIQDAKSRALLEQAYAPQVTVQRPVQRAALKDRSKHHPRHSASTTPVAETSTPPTASKPSAVPKAKSEPKSTPRLTKHTSTPQSAQTAEEARADHYHNKISQYRARWNELDAEDEALKKIIAERKVEAENLNRQKVDVQERLVLLL